MNQQFVPPAILCIVATYPVWTIIGLATITGNISSDTETVIGRQDVIGGLFLPGLFVLYFSIVLLLDSDRRRWWGTVVAVFYVLVGVELLVMFSTEMSAQYAQYGGFQPIEALLEGPSPILGLIGAVWSKVWKPSRTKNLVASLV